MSHVAASCLHLSIVVSFRNSQTKQRLAPPVKCFISLKVISDYMDGRSGGVVVKLLACGARGLGINSLSRPYDLVISCFFCRNMAEISLKRCKSSKQPTKPRMEYCNVTSVSDRTLHYVKKFLNISSFQ